VSTVVRSAATISTGTPTEVHAVRGLVTQGKQRRAAAGRRCSPT